jgi:hypothetical protein
MFSRSVLAAAALAAALSFPAQAQQERPHDTDYSTKKICKVENQIGTRLGSKKICRTRAEWDQIRAHGRQVVERVQASTSACLRGGICAN